MHSGGGCVFISFALKRVPGRRVLNYGDANKKTVMQIESDDNEGDNDDDSDNGVSTRMHTIKTNKLVNSGLFRGLLKQKCPF